MSNLSLQQIFDSNEILIKNLDEAVKVMTDKWDVK